MAEVPTYGLFVDTVYDERFLTVLTRKLFTGARDDPGLVRLAPAVAAGAQLADPRTHLAARHDRRDAFSLAGLPTVCLLCQDATRLVPNYHTRRDALDHIRPASLGVMLQMVLDLMSQIDTEESVRTHAASQVSATAASTLRAMSGLSRTPTVRSATWE